MGDWRNLARCRPVGEVFQTSKFFPEHGDSAIVAKSLCHVCPVRKLCLAEALLDHEDFGVWGGTSRADRKPMFAILAATPSFRPDFPHLPPAATDDEGDTEFTFVIAV